MSIQPVGMSYYAPQANAAPRYTAAPAATTGAYAADAYQGMDAPQGSGLDSGQGTGGMPLGRILSWAGGAFGAFKLVCGVAFRGGGSPAGWALAATLGAGAFAGNWLYNKLTGR